MSVWRRFNRQPMGTIVGGLQHYWGAPARMKAKRKRRSYAGRYRGGAYNPSRELKFFDTTIDDVTISATGDIQSSVNLIAQGVSEDERIGRKCTVHRIQWRGTLILKKGTSEDSSEEAVRVIMYLDKQANGAVATNTQILHTASYQAFYNLENKGRFRILLDRTWALNATAGGGNGTTSDTFSKVVTFSMNRKVNIPIEFSLNTGAIGEIRSNNIGILLISRNALSSIISTVRVRFTG